MLPSGSSALSAPTASAICAPFRHRIAERDRGRSERPRRDDRQQSDRPAAGHNHLFAGDRPGAAERVQRHGKRFHHRAQAVVDLRRHGKALFGADEQVFAERRRWWAAWCWRCPASARGGRDCHGRRGSNRNGRIATPGSPPPAGRSRAGYTPSATAATSPVISWPRMNGAVMAKLPNRPSSK